jgi:hypothetical protein
LHSGAARGINYYFSMIKLCRKRVLISPLIQPVEGAGAIPVISPGTLFFLPFAGRLAKRAYDGSLFLPATGGVEAD